MARFITLLSIAASVARSCDALKHKRGDRPSVNATYLAQEIDFIAPLHERLTGSPQHNALIDRIQDQLEALNLTVFTDTLKFTYFDGPLSDPKFTVNGNEIPLTSYSKYSGTTDSQGVSGELVDVTTTSLTKSPNWDLAKGKIAIANITNIPYNIPAILPVWPGSPPWQATFGNPEVNAESLVLNLTGAAQAGVKAVVYAWQNASTGLVDGQWVPFHALYQGVPAVFVQGDGGKLQDLISASKNGSNATVTLAANMVPNTPARTIWTVFEGTDLKNESYIINTHSDGTNVVEENGYIALLAYAQYLAKNPPRRTTILVFVGQHLHYEAFMKNPQRATSRWLYDHPEYWAGQGNGFSFEYGGQLKAVAGTCIEHLAAVHWDQDMSADTWFATNQTEPELIYAATAEFNQLLRDNWVGADPNVTRITNPVQSLAAQGGEGYPFFLLDIPNWSLITNPSYLLKIFDQDFDERRLIDMQALERQVGSIMKIWQIMDGMSGAEFGMQNVTGIQKPLNIYATGM